MTVMVFCRWCGAEIHEAAPHCPKYGAPQPIKKSAQDWPDWGKTQDWAKRIPEIPKIDLETAKQSPRTLGSATMICLKNYADGKGRAPRSEFWYFQLFTTLVCLASGIFPLLAFIITVSLIPPTVAVSIRRLHDLGHTGWWYFLIVIPVVGWIWLLIWACTPGTQGPNRYGANPLLRAAETPARRSEMEQGVYLGQYDWPTGEEGIAWFSDVDGCLLQKVPVNEVPQSAEEAEAMLQIYGLTSERGFT